MRKALKLTIAIGTVIIIAACTASTRNQKHTTREPQPSDTLYTQEAAMSIYAYQPLRALQIIDSAVIVGNMQEWKADLVKTRVYTMTQVFDPVDSLLGGQKGIRFDSARVICERLLTNDSVKAEKKRLLDVLETLIYTARKQNDTTRWMLRSREYVDICHEIGASQATNALRTEAEIGAALCTMGHHQEGMAKLDSAIYQLDATFHRQQNRGMFSELDALIIALKRKISQLASDDKYAETLPLARLIIERLQDYEQHPDAYHDGSYREPKDSVKRSDYIRFYRSQAQNYITAAYSSLGEHGSMLSAFEQIENSVREATVREHLARYQALQQQIEAERQQVRADNATMTAIVIGVLALLILLFAVTIVFKNRAISRKNMLLAKQITETVSYKNLYWSEKREKVEVPEDTTNLETLTDEQLFQHINDVIVRERLFLNPKLERQNIMERFQLSKERVGAIFSNGSNYAKLTSYLQQLRLEYATKLLVEQPEKSIVQIASESGFSSNAYFSNCFRQRYSISPSEFRRDALKLFTKKKV